MRGSAQVNSTIPPAEGLVQTADAGLREGFLTLVGNRQPAAPPIRPGPLTEVGTTSPSGGMSGAVVTAEGMIIGVVRSVNLADDGQSLTVTPVTSLDHLPDGALARRFWDVLGIADSAGPALLPASKEPESGGASGRSGGNPLAVRRSPAARLLTEFLARHPHPGHDKADGAGHGPYHPAGDSEVSHAQHEGTDSAHHGPHHDETHHEDTQPADPWYDDQGLHYG